VHEDIIAENWNSEKAIIPSPLHFEKFSLSLSPSQRALAGARHDALASNQKGKAAMSRKYVITTPYGKRYFIHANGEIERADGHAGPSKTWLLLGLSSTKHRQFGKRAISFANLDAWLETTPELRYKNGNPLYTMIDLDHGTTRVHGNTRMHGIATIQRV
jgi:hypothetical protein